LDWSDDDYAGVDDTVIGRIYKEMVADKAASLKGSEEIGCAKVHVMAWLDISQSQCLRRKPGMSPSNSAAGGGAGGFAMRCCPT